MYGSKAEGLIF